MSINRNDQTDKTEQQMEQLTEQLANKIKTDCYIDYLAHKKEIDQLIKSDCNIIKNEFIESMEKISKGQISNYTYYYGAPFKISSSNIFFNDEKKLLSECDFNVAKYEDKLTKLSGQKVSMYLIPIKSNKLGWMASIRGEN